MAKKSGIDGFADLERTFKQLGKVPQTAATKSARAGASIAQKSAKANAPVDEGNLKQGIIMKRERRTKQGKAVFDVMMDPAKNDIFVKISKSGKRSYYPASQEYGFLTVDGGYVPGYRFLRNSVTENAEAIRKKIVETAGKEVDKAMRG
ncbi:HK97-gp10 family putative phage morphogenesis protein [Paenibacillus ginsengarvi]|uniref:HK97 gp10 family phage protein n=1 Tax=Paenibacillus ginsengarvi TaxID=400777 RepID=A0A3B0CM43_9BACL|nr:HK97-gp10 family putative phage morphogenesis protein [Paenibacillus ginsengarvi]RKN86745.1 HK97 gp10 family phage protein [Paenibacillus ginsengarvi]